MSTRTLVPLQEYLHTSYSPDVDYVEGELQERNMGEYDHGIIQTALVRRFSAHREDWGIKVTPELRLQTDPMRFRVPDITVMRRDAPREQITTHAPLIAIEILSPEDRYGRMEDKINEYLAIGIENVWVIDPKTQAGFFCTSGSPQGWTKAEVLTVQDSPVNLVLRELFADLD